LIQLLLDKGADITTKITTDETALHISESKEWGITIVLLLERGVSTEGGETKMDAPAHGHFGGHKEMVWPLLKDGADKAARNSDGDIALDVAVAKGHKAMAGLLLLP
jgi:ankyrin repeat protein